MRLQPRKLGAKGSKVLTTAPFENTISYPIYSFPNFLTNSVTWKQLRLGFLSPGVIRVKGPLFPGSSSSFC